MKNKFLFLLSFLPAFFIISCSKNVETISVVRNPYLNVTKGTETLNGSDFKLNGPTDAVAYLSDTAKTGKKVFRYSFQSSLKAANQKNLQLIISFDTSNPNDFRNIYKTTYNSSGGLHEASLLVENSNQSYTKYRLTNNPNIYFEVNRLSTDERIFAGSFNLLFQNERDSTDLITLSNGKFEDIQY
ncbi:MAG: hypothetical protein IE931_03530 [Sphingobacteriales bacterium]|nr:hypothetical protein [Sphingobacteriales bacterium]